MIRECAFKYVIQNTLQMCLFKVVFADQPNPETALVETDLVETRPSHTDRF